MNKAVILFTLLLSILIVFGVGSCTYVTEKRTDIELCWADPECKASAIERSKVYKDTSVTLVAMAPAPVSAASPIVGTVVGYLSLLVFLMSGGAALRKKEVVP